MPALAVTRYVNLANPSPAAPYTSWATAAQTIQAAVNVSANGDVVVVTNGVYAVGSLVAPGTLLPSRVMVTNRLTIRSVNGPAATIIFGQGPLGIGATRCVYLSNQTVLTGFTLSNGATRTDGDITLDRSGGGAFLVGNSSLSNCVVTRCIAQHDGGGAYLHRSGFVSDTLFVSNTASNDGGGAACYYGGTLALCTVAGNRAGGLGGGIHGNNTAVIDRCELYRNSATDGGGIYGNSGPVVNNSLLYLNRAAQDGGGMFLNGNATKLFNSTVCDNHAVRYGGGVLCRLGGSNINCVIYFNTAAGAGSNHYVFTSGYYDYCCTTPMPPSGVGNITANPQIVDGPAYDYHLSAASPCVNAGNNTLAVGVVDLDGRQRILGSPAQIVDMGCFEAVPQDSSSAPRYVSPGGGNVWPYSAPVGAARHPQDAIDAAMPGDTIELDGAYARGYRGAQGLRNRIVLKKNLTLNGNKPNPEATQLIGAPDLLTGRMGTNAVRCAYLSAGTLQAVTLRGGYTRVSGSPNQTAGGGALLYGGGTLTNCAVRDSVGGAGGGVFCESGGLITRTAIVGNHGGEAGGGVLCNAAAVLQNCLISNNVSDRGAGAYLMNNPTRAQARRGPAPPTDPLLDHCTITDNAADTDGGGVYLLNAGLVQYSALNANQAYNAGGALYCSSGGRAAYNTVVDNNAIDAGGGVYLSLRGDIVNCLLVSNEAIYGGGAFFYYGGLLDSCTVAANAAVHGGGGVYCNYGGTNRNCIIFANRAIVDGETNYVNNGKGATYWYSCSTPALTGSFNAAGNITNDPAFVGGGDFRLLEGSPCIDAGTNLPWMVGATDLDGNPRTHDGTVDMGCYEFIPEPTLAGMLALGMCGLARATRVRTRCCVRRRGA
jgi:hypothetical protein